MEYANRHFKQNIKKKAASRQLETASKLLTLMSILSKFYK